MFKSLSLRCNWKTIREVVWILKVCPKFICLELSQVLSIEFPMPPPIGQTSILPGLKRRKYYLTINTHMSSLYRFVLEATVKKILSTTQNKIITLTDQDLPSFDGSSLIVVINLLNRDDIDCAGELALLDCRIQWFIDLRGSQGTLETIVSTQGTFWMGLYL